MPKKVTIDGEEYQKVDKTLTVHFILDDSGSMNSVQKATISSFNEYVKSLQTDKKNSYKFSLTKFADYIETKDIQDINEVKPLTTDTYMANGSSTSLYDAVCMTLHDVENNPGKNLVVILTDGEENSSKEYSEKDFRELVKKLEAKDTWTFTYLGANQDSYAVAQRFGFKKGNVSNYHTSAAGMRSVGSNLAQSTVAMASSGDWSTQEYFSKEQQDEMEETK
jgi:von Willebrand factor type A domain